jgi:hypothetical protein
MWLGSGGCSYGDFTSHGTFGDETRAAEKFISGNSIETVELAVVDTMGAIRGKRIPAPVFLQNTDFGISSGLFCLDYGLDVLPPVGRYSWASGYPDVFLVPDAGVRRQGRRGRRRGNRGRPIRPAADGGRMTRLRPC